MRFIPPPSTQKYLVLATALVLLIASLTLRPDIPRQVGSKLKEGVLGHEKSSPPIVYKPKPEKAPQIKDNFPLARSQSDLPPIPSYNAPPNQHVSETTPLFIGFTQNWPLLQQAVVGYITAGWPPSDIYVVDNTGTMNSNELRKLTLQNPFYLDHDRLTNVFGVNVVTTPTLLSFAQLQNFYMHFALRNDWKYYFWGHMDVAILSEEGWKDENGTYKSLYTRAVDALRETQSPEYPKWALRFYSYDYLELVNLEAFMEVGGWDSWISYYMTDCDFIKTGRLQFRAEAGTTQQHHTSPFHEQPQTRILLYYNTKTRSMHDRLGMHGYKLPTANVGDILDVGESPEDLLVYYRRKSAPFGKSWGDEDALDSDEYKRLRTQLKELENDKRTGEGGRNLWHSQQTGGKGEPFHIPLQGFQEAFEKAVTNGREIFEMKWGKGSGCGLKKYGLKPEDAWMVEKVKEAKKPE